ncbi:MULTISPECIES: MFS transporter [Streptomyces]|uniref:ACS family D-galactonate transporter-like MFS transporter n=1 Tax=Streptomyces nymphaeiformis TaxID=2663842 RepID=A0A7W7U6U4_9ACTN|nr:MFS transporter [Streptomyces nymphaeiformis]MBB4985302.1 ACS family D-galactonate transporter-like MFS transporter [Streptomyces nymphaeiformis]
MSTTPLGKTVPAATAPAPAGGRPSRVRWKMFVLLLGVVALNYIDRGSVSVALPLITDDLGLSKETTGFVLSAFFWTYALMQIPGGWLADRFGPRRMVSGACIGWGVAQAATAAATGAGSLLGYRLLLGAVEAPVMPAGGKLNAQWLPAKERGRGAVLLDGGAPLGAALGGILISALIAWTGSWRTSFVIAGVLTVVIGLCAAWYVRDTPREHPGVNDAEASYIESAHAAEDAAGPADERTGLRPYLRHRSFWAMCLGWMGFNGVFYGLLTWGPLYLSETKGFDIKTIGWSTLVIFGSGFVGELTGGWISDRRKAAGAGANAVMRTMMGVAGAAVVAGLLGVVLVPDPTTAVVLLSAVMFFLRWAGLYWSLPSTLAGRSNAGVVGGAMNLAGNIAGIVTPIAVGYIVGGTGSYTWALLYFVGAGVLFTVSSLVIDYSRRLAVR